MGLLDHLVGGGIPRTQPADLQKRLEQDPDIFILDVREPFEYRQGHIPGARLIPLGQLPARLKEIPQDKEIVVVCRSGNRSGQATGFLKRQGYNASNLVGGMLAWRGKVTR